MVHDLLRVFLDKDDLDKTPSTYIFFVFAGYAYWFSGTLMDYTNWAPYSDPEYNYGRGYVTLSYDGNSKRFQVIVSLEELELLCVASASCNSNWLVIMACCIIKSAYLNKTLFMFQLGFVESFDFAPRNVVHENRLR